MAGIIILIGVKSHTKSNRHNAQAARAGATRGRGNVRSAYRLRSHVTWPAVCFHAFHARAPVVGMRTCAVEFRWDAIRESLSRGLSSLNSTVAGFHMLWVML